MEHGDFTKLAKNYAQFRPGYSPFVLEAILKLGTDIPKNMRAADVGAGTGIWTRQMASQGISIDAVEPNEAMHQEGIQQSQALTIQWYEGSAEEIPLKDSAYHLASMASSFHWPDFDLAIKEFERILLPQGIFTALWNTRKIENNPLLMDIEAHLHKLVPDMKRMSSGRSEFCNTLFERLTSCGIFEDVLYIEGLHTELQNPDHYVGIWESVNDVRVQAGESRFKQFIEYIRHVTKNVEVIEAQYLTRAWIARKKA